jgi:opacity protein-like surface antigen
MKLFTTAAVTMALALGSVTAAKADEVTTSFESEQALGSGNGWVVSTTPYLWLLFFEGDMTINGQTVDMSGTNLFDLLNAGSLRFPPLTNYLEARKGPWGGYLDTTFVGMDFSGSDISLGPGPVAASFGLDFTYILINAGLIYTVAEWQQSGGHVAFDTMLGMRYTHYNVDLGVAVGPVGGGFDETLDWFDLTVGGRLRGEFDNGWGFNIFADIAGAGLESDFSIQAVANVSKKFQLGSMDMAVLAGYRALYQNWDDGNDAVDLLSHGPLVGLRVFF